MAGKGRVRLDDRALRKLERELERRKNAHVMVGVLASRGGGQKHPDSDLSMVEIAAIHEFGSPAAHIPQRSFIRSAFEKRGVRGEFNRLARKLAKGIITGRLPVSQALGLLGEWGVAKVRARMAEGVPPPLAASTLAKRRRVQKGKAGSDKPLIDTGRLRQSITYEVVD